MDVPADPRLHQALRFHNVQSGHDKTRQPKGWDGLWNACTPVASFAIYNQVSHTSHVNTLMHFSFITC